MFKEGLQELTLFRFAQDNGNNGGGETTDPREILSRISKARQRQQVPSTETTQFVIRPYGVETRTVRPATPLEIQGAKQNGAGKRDFSNPQNWNSQPAIAQQTKETSDGNGHNGNGKNRFKTSWEDTPEQPSQPNKPKRQRKAESDSSTQESKPKRPKKTKPQREKENGKIRRERSGGGKDGTGRNYPERMGRNQPKSVRIK